MTNISYRFKSRIVVRRHARAHPRQLRRINIKTTPSDNSDKKIGKVFSIQLVDETSELMVISEFGKIIRIDTKSVWVSGRSTSGVKLLDLDTDDKVAAAVSHPIRRIKSEPETGTLLQ